MHILLAGEWVVDVYEAALMQAFLQLGHTVTPFPWRHYVARARGPVSVSPGWWAAKLSTHFGLAPLLARVGDGLVDLARRSQPDVIFIYRGIVIPPRTLARLRQAAPRATTVSTSAMPPRWRRSSAPCAPRAAGSTCCFTPAGWR